MLTWRVFIETVTNVSIGLRATTTSDYTTLNANVTIIPYLSTIVVLQL